MSEKRTRVNRQIRVPEIRLIDEEGNQAGVVNTAAALTTAEEKGLDLVEVAPLARPPVCRLMDFGKYLYEQRKRQRETRKGQSANVIKEIKLSAKIDDHDIQFKIVHIKKFLARKNRVKVTVVFRGRELSHTELGSKVLDKVRSDLDGFAVIEQEPKLEGRTMYVLFAPAKKKPSGAEKAGSDAVKETHA